ncbi:MAG: 50S ribosomal protein L15 [Candidatus Cloacimonetes bacterium]|nr:50S ribosomal protein L15 [Candidatus Cloacimonadota bacterium]
MELHNMVRPKIKKHKKRLGKGHGTGQGTQAGKGHKGQKARTSGGIPAWFEGGQMPIQRRLPKRGFKNIFKKEYRIVKLEQLQNYSEAEYTIETLESLGLIKKSSKNTAAPVKVLANDGDNFNKKITIKANAFSTKAKDIIEKNGGKAEVV